MSTCIPCMDGDHARCRYITNRDCVCVCEGPTSRRGQQRASVGQHWSPVVVAAAKAMYKRLRVADPDLPKWKRLDIDSTDHYCIAAQDAIEAFHRAAIEPVEVEL